MCAASNFGTTRFPVSGSKRAFVPVLFFWNQLKLGAPTSRTDPIQVPSPTPMLITSKIGSLLFVACIVMQLASTLAAQNIQHDYCILGAGPGGLQVGHLMLKRGWDYITFERNARPGSFFETYPVHRQLISLNKRYTGRNSKEFNLRHDWNSLLDSVRLFIFSLSQVFS